MVAVNVKTSLTLKGSGTAFARDRLTTGLDDGINSTLQSYFFSKDLTF